MEFILGIKGWFDVRNSINRTININKAKEINKLSSHFLPQNAHNKSSISLWFFKI